MFRLQITIISAIKKNRMHKRMKLKTMNLKCKYTVAFRKLKIARLFNYINRLIKLWIKILVIETKLKKRIKTIKNMFRLIIFKNRFLT